MRGEEFCRPEEFATLMLCVPCEGQKSQSEGT